MELLLLVSREPEHAFGVPELTVRLRPADVPENVVQRYLSGFQHCGLVACEEGRYRYAPTSASASAAVGTLARLYNERPVTLVRGIYALKDEGIRAFADAFKLGEP